MRTQINVRLQLISSFLTVLLSGGLLSPELHTSHAAMADELKRINCGDLTLYFTINGPLNVQWKNVSVLEKIYCYTAVEDDGRYKEGFNWRDLDGNLIFIPEIIEGGFRLTWQNKRYIYNNRIHKTDQLAGEMTLNLILQENRLTLEYSGKIEPRKGFGEIGFYLPEAMLRDLSFSKAKVVKCSGEVLDVSIDSLFKNGNTGVHPISEINLSSENILGINLSLTFGIQQFPGSRGVFFQDNRCKADIAANTDNHYRVVMSFDTTKGVAFKYNWEMRIIEK